MKHYQSGFSFSGIIKSFQNSIRGFRVLLHNEYNLYIQLGFGFLITIMGFIFSISSLEWIIQFTVIGLVIFSELINTAFEKTMDLVNPDYDERVRDIKDLASAAVLFMVLISIIVGMFIYVPKLYIFFFV
jgi:diacylglycerol kinase (ATP)